jgi:DDE superfamily endonuclease
VVRQAQAPRGKRAGHLRPDGWPLWVSPVRPGREHDITCARTHGLINALNRLAAALDLPTLTDLGYENVGPGFRHPVKKPQGGELTEHRQAFNKVIRGIHGVAERANALLKVTFKALRRVSLDPAAITRIARAALVLLQLEHGRPPDGQSHRDETLPRKVHCCGVPRLISRPSLDTCIGPSNPYSNATELTTVLRSKASRLPGSQYDKQYPH